MNYLSAELIKNDMKRFATGLSKMYGIEQPEIYVEEHESNQVFLGYSFLKDGNRAILKMPYFRNEQGELALDEANKVWTVEYQGLTSSGYKTIGDALEIGLDIQRVQ